MFGLLEGTVDLTWNGDGGHERIQAGDVFGAGALVTPEHRRFGNAIALTDCQLLIDCRCACPLSAPINKRSLR